jgi:ribosomal protein L11 methyltransferase
LIRLAVRCGPAAADLVLAELLQLAPGGVEEESGPGWVEYAIYGAPGELPELGTIEAVAGDEPIEVSAEEIPDDWADRWRDFHEATSIADGRVVIRPSWEPRPATDPAGADAGADSESPSRRRGQGVQAGAEQPAGIDVVIDPGQAFGTGAHPTTRMCVELMLELADAGEASGSLADLGTGSGVLAIVAARLGWDPVLAVDHEAAAVEAAAANAAANGAAIEPVRLNLREQAPPAAATVIANLTAPLLRDVARQLAAQPPPRTLVCSGLLEREVDETVAAFAAAGLLERDRRRLGDWAAVGFRAG